MQKVCALCNLYISHLSTQHVPDTRSSRIWHLQQCQLPHSKLSVDMQSQTHITVMLHAFTVCCNIRHRGYSLKAFNTTVCDTAGRAVHHRERSKPWRRFQQISSTHADCCPLVTTTVDRAVSPFSSYVTDFHGQLAQHTHIEQAVAHGRAVSPMHQARVY